MRWVRGAVEGVEVSFWGIVVSLKWVENGKQRTSFTLRPIHASTLSNTITKFALVESFSLAPSAE